MFAALCDNPEFFRDKLGTFIAMAPTMYVGNTKSETIKQCKDFVLEN